MKLIPKNNFELEKMRAAGQLAAAALDFITPHIKPGVSTLKLNDLCHEFITARGAVPATLGYKGYPKSSCISLNQVVCHGIPSADEKLKEGDILNIDITALKDGFHGDTSRMYIAGEASPQAKKLVATTYKAMIAGIATVKSGSFLHEIGNAIDAVCTPEGYGVVREYCGHGLGRVFHEDPQVLHYASTEMRPVRLKKGLCFTVEPMVNAGNWRTKLMPDGWTTLTADGSLSAQWEHSLAVTEDGFELFTQSPEYGDAPPFSQ